MVCWVQPKWTESRRSAGLCGCGPCRVSCVSLYFVFCVDRRASSGLPARPVHVLVVACAPALAPAVARPVRSRGRVCVSTDRAQYNIFVLDALLVALSLSDVSLLLRGPSTGRRSG